MSNTKGTGDLAHMKSMNMVIPLASQEPSLRTLSSADNFHILSHNPPQTDDSVSSGSDGGATSSPTAAMHYFKQMPKDLQKSAP